MGRTLPKGVIHIDDCPVFDGSSTNSLPDEVANADRSSGGKLNLTFGMQVQQTTYLFRAATAAEKDFWITTLKKHDAHFREVIPYTHKKLIILTHFAVCLE